MKRIVLIFFIFLNFSCTQSKEEANVFFLKGNEAFKDQNYKRAIELYNEALQKNANFADAYNNIGICYQNLQKPTEARINFEKGLEIDPDFVKIKINYINFLIENNNLILAEKLWSEIKTNEDQNPDYQHITGKIKFIKSDFVGGLLYLQKAVSLEKSNPIFLTDLATIEFELKNYNSAKKLLEKSFSIDNQQPYTRNNLGLVYQKEKKLNEAEKLFKELVSENPSNQIFKNNLCYNFILQKNIVEAEKIIEKSVKESSDPYLNRNIGLIKFAKNDFKNAVQYLEKAWNQNANLENIHFYLAQNYFKLGNKEKANEFAKKSKILNEELFDQISFDHK